MWITSPPLEAEEAREALQKAVPDLDEYFKKGQIEITSYNNWYLLEGKFDSNRVLQGWVEKEKTALKHGFEGMRLTGNTFWIERELWNSFDDYEEALNSVIGQHRILVLCTYCLKNCSGADVLDVVRNHVGTLIKQGRKWSFIEDAAQRKKAEDAIRKSEQRYRSYIEVTGELGWTTNADGEVVEDIPSWRNFTGQTFEEVKGSGWSKALHPDDLEKTLKTWKRATQEKSKYEVEYRLRRNDGVYRYFMTRGVPVFKEDGNIREWVGTCIDITERKQNEEKLRRLNRTLRAISNSNQALMCATDEASFLQEACRIIAEDCGYRMVWVGLAEDDEAKSVRPVAYAGFEKGYLDALKITWSDTERGRGPTGRAISTGQPQFCQNMQADPTFKPWREEALKRGYASSIALPLKSDSKVFGALNMYSTEPGACSADEVKLLTELANDFAHGIMMLRLRSEKERAEAEIRKQATLINLSPDGIIVRELEGTIIFWSKGAEKLYGWTEEEATGQSAHKLLKTKFPEPYESIIAKLKQTGKWSGELIHTAKTGRHIMVQSWWQPKLDQHGEIVELMESNVDITERNKAENELRETRDYLENLLNYANAPVIVWDPKFRITLFNHAFERLTGLNANDVIEKPLEILFPEDKKEEAMAHIKRTLEGEYWETVEIPILDVDGNVKTVLWNSANIYDPNGKAIVATIAQGHDITVRKQMEKKLEEYSKHLEQLVEERTKQLRDSERLATIGATAGMVGHDIRNPLQAIIGDVFLAKTDLSSLTDSEQKTSVQESLFEIEKNVEYINKIVADLQDFAKPLNPTAMEIDLKRIIDEVVSNRRIPGNIQASIKVEKNAERIVADSAYVQRILSNLVNNAVQAMPNGGKLTVHAYCEGKDNVITVEDTGVGIPEEAKSKLFTPLFTTKPKGQGFGLAVVKRMTEALDGTVTFESQADKGTKFIVRLPKRTNDKQAAK
jgi:PAS domain S-box-containing protein